MLFCKTISASAGCRNSLLIAALLLAAITGISQTVDTLKVSRVRGLPSVNTLLPVHGDMIMYRKLIDSLNQRKLLIPNISGKDTGLTSFLRTTLQTGPLAGMKDSVMGEFLYYVKNNFGADRVNKIVKDFSLAGDSASLTTYIASKIKGYYSIKGMESLTIPSFSSLIRNQLNTVSYAVVHDNSYMSPVPWMHQVHISNEAMLMDIPFQINFSNLSNDAVPLTCNNLVKVSFNKDGFQQGLQQKLGKYYNMKKYLLADMDMLSYVKKHFESELTQKLKRAASDIIPNPSKFLEGRLSYDELLKLDMDQIREKIIPAGDALAIKERIQAYEVLLKERGASMNTVQKDSLLLTIKNQSAYLSSIQQLTEAIQNVKDKLSGSGMNANQIARMQQAINAKAISGLQQPEVIKEAATNLLPLNGLQRFFTKVQSLQAGTFSMQQSERTISALIRGGVQLSALKNNKLFSGGLGQLKDGGLLKDAGLSSSQINPASFLQFLQFGKGQEGKNQTRFSVVNSNTFSTESAMFSQLSLPRNVLAGTVSKTMRVRRTGLIEAEISKSATQYRNTVNNGADLLMEHKSALLSYADDFWQTLSAGLRYMDEWETIGLSHNAHISYAGFGYNNPGNPSSAKGSLQYDLQVRKDIDKRKGSVQAQFANRQYNYSGNSGRQWSNLQFNFQGRYRFSRKFTLSGKYNQYQLVRKEEDSRRKMYVSRKLSADIQYSGAIAGRPQRTHFSLGWQQFSNIVVLTGGTSNLLLVQWLSSVAVGNVAVTGSLFYNKEMADQALIGNLLTAEIGAGYTVLKSVSLSSAVTYLDNNIAARQLGIRQSVNAAMWKNWSIGLYLDCRKNLIAPINEYLYGSFRGELSVHYLIN